MDDAMMRLPVARSMEWMFEVVRKEVGFDDQ
jgi:hypothetical protein